VASGMTGYADPRRKCRQVNQSCFNSSVGCFSYRADNDQRCDANENGGMSPVGEMPPLSRSRS
jgi:hypothetical protein